MVVVEEQSRCSLEIIVSLSAGRKWNSPIQGKSPRDPQTLHKNCDPWHQKGRHWICIMSSTPTKRGIFPVVIIILELSSSWECDIENRDIKPKWRDVCLTSESTFYPLYCACKCLRSKTARTLSNQACKSFFTVHLSTLLSAQHCVLSPFFCSSVTWIDNLGAKSKSERLKSHNLPTARVFGNINVICVIPRRNEQENGENFTPNLSWGVS